jgi:hypothetical protein
MYGGNIPLLLNHSVNPIKLVKGGMINSNTMVGITSNRLKLSTPLDYINDKNTRADIVNIGGRLNRINFTPIKKSESGLIRTLF